MNARMTGSREITLPDDVVDALHLAPGSEVAFRRGPGGEIILVKAANQEEPSGRSAQEIRRRLENVAAWAREHINPEVAGTSTDEYMKLMRGD